MAPFLAFYYPTLGQSSSGSADQSHRHCRQTLRRRRCVERPRLLDVGLERRDVDDAEAGLAGESVDDVEGVETEVVGEVGEEALVSIRSKVFVKKQCCLSGQFQVAFY